MGFNLNRLKQQYGVGSASQLQYAGAVNPGDTFAYNEDAINAAEEAISEADQLAAYNAQMANYTADRSAYDSYSDQYNQRLQGTPMYANKQYQTQKEAAPNTVNEMYEKYLGQEFPGKDDFEVFPMDKGNSGFATADMVPKYDDEGNFIGFGSSIYQSNDGSGSTGGADNGSMTNISTGFVNQYDQDTGNYLYGPADNIQSFDNAAAYSAAVAGAKSYPTGANDAMPYSYFKRLQPDGTYTYRRVEGMGRTASDLDSNQQEYEASLGGGGSLGGGKESFDFMAPANLGDTHYDPALKTTYTYTEKPDGQGGFYSGWDITEGTGGTISIPEDNFNQQNPNMQVSDAERNAFLRNAETEFANLGIDNTGNQNVMNQIGNYYGNILGAPVNLGNVYGYGGKPDTGGVVIDIGTGGGDTGVVDTGGGSSGDGTVVSSSDNGNSSLNNFMTDHSTRVAADIAAKDGEKGDTSVLGSVFSGGGDDGFGNYGAVGDFFGGIGDALNITNYDGSIDGQPSGNDGGIGFSSSDDDDDGGSWSESNWNPSNWFNAEGGYIKGYSNGTTEPIDAALDLDELAAKQLKLAEQTTAPNAAALQKMLRENTVTSQDSSVSGLEKKYQDSTKAFQSAMSNLATQESKGPSESEKWFRISAAFGKPTQSGNFFDGLGNVSEALGDIERERREARSTGNQLLLENSRFSMDLLKEQLATGRTLQADERNYNRTLQEMLYNTQVEAELLSQERVYDLLTEQEKRQWEADNKANLPQTVAAKAATDLGYKRGTDEYVKYIKDYYENQQKIAKLEVETLARQTEQLTTPVLSLLVETDNAITGQSNAINLLEQALSVNKLAYTDSYADRLGNFLAGQFDSNDPKYQATEQLMNLLSKGALATLKATFGGNISDGERRANLDLQGTGSKNRESRALIIQQALTTMLDLKKRTQEKLVKIKSGEYSTRTPIAQPDGEE